MLFLLKILISVLLLPSNDQDNEVRDLFESPCTNLSNVTHLSCTLRKNLQHKHDVGKVFYLIRKPDVDVGI